MLGWAAKMLRLVPKYTQVTIIPRKRVFDASECAMKDMNMGHGVFKDSVLRKIFWEVVPQVWRGCMGVDVAILHDDGALSWVDKAQFGAIGRKS